MGCAGGCGFYGSVDQKNCCSLCYKKMYPEEAKNKQTNNDKKDKPKESESKKSEKVIDAQKDSPSFTFKKLIGNVANTSSKLFAAKNLNKNENEPIPSKPSKTMKALEDEIEILQLQKQDLRKLVEDRTYKLDQLKKLDAEHQKLRKRWKENEEKAENEVSNIRDYSEALKQEIKELKQQNLALQAKQTNNDLIKNKLEIQIREILEEKEKNKKFLERKVQEKKLLVAEVLKLRNEKQEIINLYKTEIEKLNKNNKNNIDQLRMLHDQQSKSKEIENKKQMKQLNNVYNELNLKYTNYKENISDKVSNIDSTTKAFESMITNANIGNLSQSECNKILENIINSIESMEMENEHYLKTMDDAKNDETKNKNDDELMLNQIESRMLRSLREKALLQQSSNELMLQLQELQKQHEKVINAKDEIIKQHEIRAKVKFFGNRKNSKQFKAETVKFNT